MGELDQKLMRRGGIAERVTRIISRRNAGVANRTDKGLCPFEKLRTMTTDAGSVAGIVCDVGKVSYFFPVIGGNFMAGVAGLLVLVCSMRESGIVN
jgi:hypothetical protein